MIITIDGPSGTGKTTVARRVAERVGFIYFDTGAMYRALTWLALEKNADLSDPQALDRLLLFFDFKIEEAGESKKYFIGDEEVTEVIRSRWVTAHVSQVAAQKSVRSALLKIQHHFAVERNVIFEGRDLGTVVFPNAEIKIYLTADPQIRAQRRLQEMRDKLPQEESQNVESVLADMIRRDELDSNREVAPLRCPVGAHQIDTTYMTLEEVISQVVDIVHRSRATSEKS